MTTELLLPPAGMWDRIEKILDDQDNDRKYVHKIISDTFTHRDERRKKYFLAALAVGAMVAALVLSYK